MVYLVGGAMRCGKTTFLLGLRDKYDIPYISVDELRENYYNGLSDDKKKNEFPIFTMDESDISRFKKYSLDENVVIELKEAKTSQKLVLELINKKPFGDQDYIIEGLQLTPDFVSGLIDKHPDDIFKTIFIVRQNSELILKGIINHIDEGGNCWLKDLSPYYLKQYSYFISELSKYIIKESDKYGFEYVNTEVNFYEKIKKLLNRF